MDSFPARRYALLFLRVSLGLFLVVWGGDKLVNAEHAQNVSEAFYFGLVSGSLVITVGGALEMALGILVMLGVWRHISYAGLLLIVTATLFAVWKSILDPLGLFMDGGNPVFFASLVIEAGAVVLWAHRKEE